MNTKIQGGLASEQTLGRVLRINETGTYGAKSFNTTPALAAVAASNLANRTLLVVTPTNGTVYWGFDSSVSAASGQPINRLDQAIFSVGPSVSIFLIASSGTVNVRLSEAV